MTRTKSPADKLGQHNRLDLPRGREAGAGAGPLERRARRTRTGIPLVVLPRADGKSHARHGPHNVLIERKDRSRVVRSFRGLRRIPSATQLRR